MHGLLIAAHAATATAALACGVVALLTGRLFTAHRATVLAMTVFLLGAVVVGWGDLVAGSRVVFCALLVLTLAMCVVSVRAGRLPRQPPGPEFVDRIGFTCISLSVGFVVVSLLNSGLPAWVGVGAGVGTVLVGRVLVHLAATRPGVASA